MFGYITIHKEELKIKDYDRYRAYYCGLCQELGKRCGSLSRLTLTYDMTFLTILLTGLYEAEPESAKKFCILHPGSKQLTLTNEFTEYAADMNILLAYHNLKDDWADEKKLPSLAVANALKKPCSLVASRYPSQADAVIQYMERLAECEKAQIPDLDTASGYTGEMLGTILACRQDEWSAGLKRLGFYLGKFIYLCDAYEDLPKDKKTGNYNPLIHYEAKADFEEAMQTILTMMAAECAREFEKLPVLMNADILRNILYSGIWARYRAANQMRREQSKKS